MPLYEFLCPTCGPFDQLRPFSEASAPAHCPNCGAAATRVITAPNLRRTPPALRAALLREEKSRYEPEVVQRPAPAEPTPPPKLRRSHGRPWQIGH
jgi:putative FmdB family regulatory protein